LGRWYEGADQGCRQLEDSSYRYDTIPTNATKDAREECPRLAIRTHRLAIRPTCEEDVDGLLNILRFKRVACSFLEPRILNEADARNELIQGPCTWKHEQRLQWTAMSGLAPCGVAGAARIDHGEISYYVHPTLWHQGYGLELVQAVCNIAREQLALEALHASVLRDNLASRRILDRLGFEFCRLEYLPHALLAGSFAVLNLELCWNISPPSRRSWGSGPA
jgi:ribosomal-protein-alanine N-acetyltransferase